MMQAISVVSYSYILSSASTFYNQITHLIQESIHKNPDGLFIYVNGNKSVDQCQKYFLYNFMVND